jgi:uncharacterized glyoxalase superfamily protein PhnB
MVLRVPARRGGSVSETQRVFPMLAYEDGPTAMDWLRDAFGFREVTRWVGEDGLLAHGELAIGDQTVMLATPTPEYRSPKRHREECEQARRWSEVPYVIDGVCVYVDDVDAHFEQARSAGATILSEPADQPGAGIRHYRAEDLEGHRWMFAQPLKVDAQAER